MIHRTGTIKSPSRPTVAQAKSGRRVIRPGDIVKLKGISGLFKVKTLEERDGAIIVTVYGGLANRRQFRTVFLDRVGVRVALADSKKAEEVWR